VCGSAVAPCSSSSSSSQHPLSVQCRGTLAQNSCASLQRLGTPRNGLWAHLRQVLADPPAVPAPGSQEEQISSSGKHDAAAVMGAVTAAEPPAGLCNAHDRVCTQQQQQQACGDARGLFAQGQGSGSGVCAPGRLSQLVAQQLLLRS
jgi:hypothetical protein